NGGRMPLSSNLGFMLRKKIDEGRIIDGNKVEIKKDIELEVLMHFWNYNNIFRIYRHKMNY
ncbi:MAG: hypothetical protein ABI297_06370, partial [Ginsengibacter sp.]